MDTNYWNPIIHVAVWGSILSWLVVPPFLSNIVTLYELDAATYFGVANEVLASAMFWWYLIIATVVALVPMIAVRIVRTELWPTLLDDVKLVETKKRNKEFIETIKKQFYNEDDQIPIIPTRWRTGYAFAHEEGFGKIISSGRYLGASAADVEQERINRTGTWMRENKRGYKKASALEKGLSKGIEASIGVVIGGTANNKVQAATDPIPLTGDDPIPLAGDDPIPLAGDDPIPLTGDPTPLTSDDPIPSDTSSDVPTPLRDDHTPPVGDDDPIPPTSGSAPSKDFDESDIIRQDIEL